jgi:hypothetical protein
LPLDLPRSFEGTDHLIDLQQPVATILLQLNTYKTRLTLHIRELSSGPSQPSAILVPALAQPGIEHDGLISRSANIASGLPAQSSSKELWTAGFDRRSPSPLNSFYAGQAEP